MANDHDGWDEYRRLILSELERLDVAVRDSNKSDTESLNKLLLDVIKLREEVVALKVKAGIWGILGGVITTIGAILLKFV
tara:strand:+ start:2350 stop:2589 length:240 start_codon:yes stop_codon:yes gene_type:complete